MKVLALLGVFFASTTDAVRIDHLNLGQVQVKDGFSDHFGYGFCSAKNWEEGGFMHDKGIP